MHFNVHCSTVYKSQDKEATQMSINRETDKDVVCIHTHTHTHTQWNITQPVKRMKYTICSNMMDLEVVIQSEINQRRKNIV